MRSYLARAGQLRERATKLVRHVLRPGMRVCAMAWRDGSLVTNWYTIANSGTPAYGGWDVLVPLTNGTPNNIFYEPPLALGIESGWFDPTNTAEIPADPMAKTESETEGEKSNA